MRRLATSELPTYSGYSFAILDDHGHSLNERGVHVAEVNPTKPYCNADFYEESDLRYCIGAAMYHLSRLMELYVAVVKLFDEHYTSVTEGNTSDARVYYEIEAFLDAARRVYETVRKVLWKHYGRGNDRWRAVFSIPKMPHGVPRPFVDVLESSFAKFGTKLKQYRDCIAHFDPLTDGGTTCWTEGFEGRWGMTVRLPENPGAQSRTAYRFETGPEALGYCHSVACHLVELCEQLVALDVIRECLLFPERQSGWLHSLEQAKARRR